MRFKLLEELGFVESSYPERATRRLADHIQHTKPMMFHMRVDSHQRNGKLLSGVLHRLTAQYSSYDPFPQCHIISSRTDNLHSLL